MDPTDGLVAFISMPGGGEMIILGIIGLLIFGNRLPEVAKSLGKSVVEFKRGLSGVQDEIERSVNASQQADVLPPPSTPSASVPASTESSAETAASSVEAPPSDVEPAASTCTAESSSPAEPSTSDTTESVTLPPETKSEDTGGALNRRLGPNGEWVTDPG